MTAVVTPILAAFLPRLWQDDLQRLRSVSETHIKRLEAVKKAQSVTATIKDELKIDVTIHDLQRELRQIIYEFAGQVVLSREELEKWRDKPFPERLFDRPHFTMPADSARRYRFNIIISYASWACFYLYFPSIIVINKLYPNSILEVIETLAHMFSISTSVSRSIVGVLMPLYFVVLALGGVVGRYRIANRALKKLHAMPESWVEEKKDSLVAQPLADTNVSLKGPVDEPQRSVKPPVDVAVPPP